MRMEKDRDDIIIEEYFEDLLQHCKRSTTTEKRNNIRKAFEFAHNAHKGVKRKSGDPYILHPIAVAKIAVTEIGLGTTSVIASLLHDVVEDTDYTVEDIESLFGHKVASIVDGLTKISEVSGDTVSLQAENFRKIVLTLSDDLRVILIKLADRLHNMRTLSSMPEHKQMKICAETLYIYAPLAHRMGLHSIKTDLENLSFKYEHPAEYAEMEKKLLQFEKDNIELYDRFIAPIGDKLDNNKYSYTISARIKSAYSVWNKMQRKDINFDEVYDLLAVRIVFKPKPRHPEKAQCWNIYSLITDLYKPKPERIRDWVSIPKANGYEALHVTVMGPYGKWIEVQIRTVRMDEIAEKGFAAHWKYKTDIDSQEGELDKWLLHIREMLEDPQPDAIEFLDSFKLNLFAKEIRVFTPKGDIVTLPKEATVLDFAYDIHTEVGNNCIGAKVNRQLVPLSTTLKSGDQVEIITSEMQSPSKDWIRFVTTAKAKNNIKAKFKQERKEIIKAGIAVFESFLKDNNIPPTSEALKKALNYFNIDNKDDFYREIGVGRITTDSIFNALLRKDGRKFVKYWKLKFWEKDKKVKETEEKGEGALVSTSGKTKKKAKELVIQDIDDFVISNCCNPIPGDDVVAVSETDGKIHVHSRMCPNAIRLMARYGDKILSVKWVMHKLMSFLAVIRLSGIDKVGVVSEVTQIISNEHNVNMKLIKFESHSGVFDGDIHLYVHNVEDLDKLIIKLTKIKGIDTVKRIEHVE